LSVILEQEKVILKESKIARSMFKQQGETVKSQHR